MSEAEAEADSEAEAEPDAVALFHPADPEALKPFLDLDDATEESEGIYAEELEDGSFLLHTFQPFAIFEENGSAAREWLAQFGEALNDVHDDPRGILFFPDTLEPEATTYAGVVEEAAGEGVWISLAAEVDIMPGGMAVFDMEALQQIAGQLIGAAPDGSIKMASSFDIAKMFEGVQGHLAATFGLEMGTPPEVVDAEVVDVAPEPEPEPALPPKPKSSA